MQGYLNTDLELSATFDLASLAGEFEKLGIHVLHAYESPEGIHNAIFEAAEEFDDPSATIDAILRAIESLSDEGKDAWRFCSERCIDVGYDCAEVERMSETEFPGEILSRISAAGASLRVTLYRSE
ncbi:MAG: hypothetical protein NUW37_19765 [Planctomycetes bacterium]|nr:hypothetical protein [Planctomycetota bacterium]